VTNIESLGTKLLYLFDNQFEGNESERKGKLYEFLDLMKDEVISAYRSSSVDSDIRKNDDMIASINAHSQAVQQRDAEIAVLKKSLKESEYKFNTAKKELENLIAQIKYLEGKIVSIQEEKNLLTQKLSKSEADLRKAET
jgi:chromosome segregation ATPase